MTLYELTYLISSNVSEEELKSLSEKIAALVQKEGGALKDVRLPIKQKLLAPVKKELTPYSINLDFYLAPEKISILEQGLKSESKILRYLLCVKKILKAEIKTPRRPLRRALSEKEISSKSIKKVELKEIEKKLEEILK